MRIEPANFFLNEIHDESMSFAAADDGGDTGNGDSERVCGQDPG
jgi:hypothetical protein